MTASQIADLLAAVRDENPLVHNITNTVVQNFSANALLALGASAAMVDNIGEAGVFARVAGGLLINLGTPSLEQREAAREAAAAATEAGTPWVLDPVAVGGLPKRTELAAELLERHPTAIRGNASEIIALAGAGTGGRGVDAANTTEEAAQLAHQLAQRTGGVVAVSGPEDLITDAFGTVYRVGNGSKLLTLITGGGCALGSTVAACLAVRHKTEASLALTVAGAHVIYGIAAERAVAQSQLPGSFAVHFLDELHRIRPEDIEAEAQIRTDHISAQTAGE